jgi:peptide chain release factor 1
LPPAASGGAAYVKLSKEHAELSPIVEAVQAYRTTERELKDAEALAGDPAADADMRAMAEEERQSSSARRMPRWNSRSSCSLLPKDAADSSSAIVEIRAGTGGDEAALFAADCWECIGAMRSFRAGRSRFSA